MISAVMSSPRPNNGRAAVLLGISGVAFAAYPLLRGYRAETGLQGAATHARSSWLLAHLLGMIRFALLAIGPVAISIFTLGWVAFGVFGVRLLRLAARAAGCVGPV
jgi:hypothetical protein